MALEAIFEFRNADQTSLINDRFRILFGRGIFDGGIVTPVAASLNVDIAAFKAVGFDGMMVRNTSIQRLSVLSDEINWIVLRAVHSENNQPTLQYEVLKDADYQSDPQKDFLIVFAVVDIIGGAAEVLASDIGTQFRDVITPLGRDKFRGILTNPALLSPVNNISEDWYFIDDGSGTDSPEIHVWNGGAWINISSSAAVDDLNTHRNNSFVDEKHLTDRQADAIAGSGDIDTAVSITLVGATATLTTPSAHKFVNGVTVKIAGANEDEYNGTFVIFNAIAATFDYTLIGTPSSPATGTITFLGAPTEDNRFVIESDPILPSQDENDALVGTSGIPSDSNPFVTSLQPVAVPREVTFGSAPAPQNQITLDDANGPYFVGTTALKGHLNFGIFDFDEDIRGVYQNTSAVNVVPETMFLDDGITPFDPSSDGDVDSDGFHSGKDLVLQSNNIIDTAFRLSFGKRSTIGELGVDRVIERGPRSYTSQGATAGSSVATVVGAHLHPNDTIALFNWADSVPFFDARDKFSPTVIANAVTLGDNRFKAGVAIQENSQQLLTDPNDFSSEVTAPNYTHVDIDTFSGNDGDSLGPFEEQDAAKVTVSATTGEITKTALSGSLTIAPRTLSLYFKAGTSDQVALRMQYTGGTLQDATVGYNLTTLAVTTAFGGSDLPVASGIDYAGRGWYRAWMSLTSTSGDTALEMGIFPSTNDAAGYSFIGFGQIEQRTYPSTIMKEVESRPDGELAYDSQMLPHKGMISFWAKRSDLLFDTTRSYIFLNGTNSLGLSILAADNRLQYVNSSGGWSNTSVSVVWDDRNWHRIGYDYGQGIIYFDNAEVHNNTGAIVIPDFTSDLNIGSSAAPDGFFNGVITEFLVEIGEINPDIQQGRQTLGASGKRVFLPPVKRQFERWSKGNRAILKEYFDVVIGLQADIDAGWADEKIENFGTTTFKAGDRVWFMAGTHSQTQNEIVGQDGLGAKINDLRFWFDPDAIIDTGADRSFTIFGDRITMEGARFQNYTQGKIVVSGDACFLNVLEGEFDRFGVTGAGSLVMTQDGGGLKTATWNIDTTTGIGTFGSLGSANLQERAEKDQPDGYAGLDSNTELFDAEIPSNIERNTNKSAVDGYPTLDSSALIVDAEIPLSIERREDKSTPNGYAGLDGAGQLSDNVPIGKIIGTLPVSKGGTGIGSQDSRKVVVTDDSGNLISGAQGDNAAANISDFNLQQLENLSENIKDALIQRQEIVGRNAANGYAGLDKFKKLNPLHLPNHSTSLLTSGTLPIARGGTGWSIGSFGNTLAGSGRQRFPGYFQLVWGAYQITSSATTWVTSFNLPFTFTNVYGCTVTGKETDSISIGGGFGGGFLNLQGPANIGCTSTTTKLTLYGRLQVGLGSVKYSGTYLVWGRRT